MVFIFKSKRAVIPVIAITLLLSVAILSYFYLSSWYYSVESEFNADLEKKDFATNVEVVKIDGSFLYLKNTFGDNLSLNSILLDGDECLLSTKDIDEGLARVDISRCTVGLNNLVPRELLIVSDSGTVSSIKLLQNSINTTLIAYFTSDVCEFAMGYKRLFGLSGLDNAHAETDGSSTYHLCIRHVLYNINVNSGVGQDIFHLIDLNNSAVWVDPSSPYQVPASWNNVSIEAVGASSYSLIVAGANPGANYACIGTIDRDDTYGSHIGDCDSVMPDKIWLKIE